MKGSPIAWISAAVTGGIVYLVASEDLAAGLAITAAALAVAIVTGFDNAHIHRNRLAGKPDDYSSFH